MSTIPQLDGKDQTEPEVAPEGAETPSTPAPISVAPDAQPPFDLLDALRKKEPRADKLWRLQCRDLTELAAYHSELASIGVRHEWDDQAITDLLIAHGRQRGKGLESAGYYARIIARARAACPGLGDAAASIPLVDQITARLGLPEHCKIIQVTEYLGEPRSYRLETAAGGIDLGGIENLTDQHKLRSAIAEIGHKIIAKLKRPEWDEVAQLLLDACVGVDTGPESTRAGMALSWLQSYLAAETIQDTFDGDDEGRLPFVHEGSVYVYVTQFRKFVRQKMYEQIGQRDLSIAMSKAGAAAAKLNWRKTSRQPWRLPAVFNPPQPAVPEDDDGSGFIEERLDLNPTAVMRAAAVHGAYRQYCDDHHVLKRLGVTALAAVLEEHGIQSDHDRHGNYWRGIRLKGDQCGLSLQ